MGACSSLGTQKSSAASSIVYLDFKVGDEVFHRAGPELGSGKIVSLDNDGLITVQFTQTKVTKSLPAASLEAPGQRKELSLESPAESEADTCDPPTAARAGAGTRSTRAEAVGTLKAATAPKKVPNRRRSRPVVAETQQQRPLARRSQRRPTHPPQQLLSRPNLQRPHLNSGAGGDPGRGRGEGDFMLARSNAAAALPPPTAAEIARGEAAARKMERAVAERGPRLTAAALREHTVAHMTAEEKREVAQREAAKKRKEREEGAERGAAQGGYFMRMVHAADHTENGGSFKNGSKRKEALPRTNNRKETLVKRQQTQQTAAVPQKQHAMATARAAEQSRRTRAARKQLQEREAKQRELAIQAQERRAQERRARQSNDMDQRRELASAIAIEKTMPAPDRTLQARGTPLDAASAGSRTETNDKKKKKKKNPPPSPPPPSSSSSSSRENSRRERSRVPPRSMSLDDAAPTSTRESKRRKEESEDPKTDEAPPA